MGKYVILTLEYCMGDYSDMEEDGYDIPTNPSDYEESFYQADICHTDMEIVGVRIIEDKE